MITINGSSTIYPKRCLICKTKLIIKTKWICFECYSYIGENIIEETLKECGHSFEYIPNHIPFEQQDDYFIAILKKKKANKTYGKDNPNYGNKWTERAKERLKNKKETDIC